MENALMYVCGQRCTFDREYCWKEENRHTHTHAHQKSHYFPYRKHAQCVLYSWQLFWIDFSSSMSFAAATASLLIITISHRQCCHLNRQNITIWNRRFSFFHPTMRWEKKIRSHYMLHRAFSSIFFRYKSTTITLSLWPWLLLLPGIIATTKTRYSCTIHLFHFNCFMFVCVYSIIIFVNEWKKNRRKKRERN